MKRNLFSVVLICFLVLTACEDRREPDQVDESSVTVDNDNSDQAMKDWEQAWNSNDPNALKSFTADDAVLLLAGETVSNDSIDVWIDSTAVWMKNLRTNSVMKEKSENFAWEAGTYTHETTRNDTLRGNGTYTFIWERAEEGGEWKLKLMNIAPEQSVATSGPQ